MFGFKAKNQKKFDKGVLRKNNISLLILDERFNSLFENAEKTQDIIRLEEKLRDLLKQEARLNTESKDIAARKKLCMDKIMQLTTEAFDKNNEAAKDEMKVCEKEIRRINERLGKIEEELDYIPDIIKETNLDLLEHTVNLVYFKIRSGQKRKDELERLIEETRAKLKEYIDEKEQLSQDGTDIYSYFHDLLGAEELEKLDNEFFK